MAVYTHLSLSGTQEWLTHNYEIGNCKALQPIAEGVENSNYFLTTSEGRYVLTIYEKRMRPEDVPFFLELMRHLAAQRIPCPLPVKRRDGALVSELEGKPAAIISFLPGRSIRRPAPHHLTALGRQVAQLHLAGSHLPQRRDNDLSLPSWQQLYEKLSPRLDEVQPGLAQDIAAELGFLEAHWPRDLPHGIIHGDLFPDNVFFDAQGRLSGLIDFYFACHDAWMYDLAIILNAWCFEAGGECNLTKSGNLLRAYGQVRPLTEAESEALPVLARGAALRFLLTRCEDWLHQVEGAMVRVKDPREYLKRLHFHRTAKNTLSYGMAM